MAGLFGGGDVIIGRVDDPPMDGYTDIVVDRSTFFGNEYRLSKYPRHTAIFKFRSDADKKMQMKGEFRKRVLALKARYTAGEKLRLLCHCFPNPCHAQWYKDVITGLRPIPDKPLFKLGSKLK